MNVCGACGEDFSSVRGFDRHRVDKHELDYPEHADGRRCLAEIEMRAVGFVRNARGRCPASLLRRPRHGREGSVTSRGEGRSKNRSNACSPMDTPHLDSEVYEYPCARNYMSSKHVSP